MELGTGVAVFLYFLGVMGFCKAFSIHMPYNKALLAGVLWPIILIVGLVKK